MIVTKKQYKYLYKRITDINIIKAAYKNMRKGKRHRIGIKKIDKNFDYYCDKIKVMLENTKPEGVLVEHPELAFHPGKHDSIKINENGKQRKIQKPSLIEQWVHHIIMLVLQPIFFKKLYMYSLGSVPKRIVNKKLEKHGGAHKGKMKMQKWIYQGFRYFIKADIRHFYNSVRVDKILDYLRTFICDDWMIHLISLCFTHFKKGIPLGFYISQWMANMYLTDLDNYIISKGFKYMRYMDDIIIIGNNKRELHKLITEIKQLLGKMRLKLKGNWQVCKFDFVKKNGKRTGRPIDYMGFKFYRNKIFLRKKILKGMARLAKRIGNRNKQGKPVFWRHAKSILSRIGWVQHTNCYDWYINHIKPYVIIRQMKKIVSKHDKEANKATMALAI